jgi:fructoselysine-6-P-deglycase FrlB-like protein
MKPKFAKDQKGKWFTNHKAHLTTHSTKSFSSNFLALLNDFARYLKDKHGQGAVQDRDVN